MIDRTRKLRRRVRFGALFWVATLMIGSATMRLALEVGPALASEKSHESAKDPHAEVAQSGQTEHSATAGMAPDAGDLEQLFRALQAREAALKLRETQIEDRMKALEIANTALDQRMAALIEVEKSLSETLTLADGASEADLARLTSVYEKMKPKDAAKLFEEMDPAFSAGFLARMKPEAAAGILAGLSAEAAYTVSVILAGRNAMVPKN